MSEPTSPPTTAPRGSLRANGGRGRRRLGEILKQRGLIDDEQLASALAEQGGLDLVDPTAVAVDLDLIRRFDLELARRHGALPLFVDDGGRVTVAIADPTDRSGLDAAGRFLDAPIDAVIAPTPQLGAAIEDAFARAHQPAPEPEPGLDVPATPPPVGPLADALRQGAGPEGWAQLLGCLVAHMLQLKADRLRFAAWTGGATGQLRVAGHWAQVLSLEGDAATTLIDGLCRLFDSDEEGILRLELGGAGEDRTLVGRVTLRVGGRQLDLRLHEPQAEIPLAELGYDAEVQRRLRQWTASREGLLLLVGPDASGRTTALRALASALAQYRQVVFVGEGPAPSTPGVRFLDGARGVPALREALALRPRVLIVDDASDVDTAQEAFSAAKDDCLVLAGISGSDAHDALQTLRDRGVPDALMGARLLGLVEQRLLRALCAGCRSQSPPDTETMQRLNLRPGSLPDELSSPGGGCPQCHGRGTFGMALLATRVELGGGVTPGCSPADLRGLVDRARPKAAVDAGVAMVLQGRVSLHEVAAALAPPPRRPVVTAEGGGWMPGMPEETVEASAPFSDGASLDQLLDLDPDLDTDDRHVILLFDPNDTSYQGLSAIVPAERCRVVAASDWDDAMAIVRRERPTAVLLPAAADPVATRGRIRAFRDDLASAFLPICVLVPPGTPAQNLLETGADEVLVVEDAATVRSGLLALIDRVT